MKALAMKTKVHYWLVVLVWLGLILAMSGAIVLADSSLTQWPPLGHGKWLSFVGTPTPAEPDVILLHSDDKAIELIAELPGCMAEDIEAEGQVYTRLYGQGYGYPTAQGLPDLPVLRRKVEIPFGAKVNLEVVDAEYIDYALKDLGLHPIYPRQPPVLKIPGAMGRRAFVIDRGFYRRGTLYPNEPVALLEEYIVRGHRIQPVEVWPVAYDPSRGVVRLHRKITFRLRLTGSDMICTQALADRYASPVFELQLARQVLNYNQTRPLGRRGPMRDGQGVGYLIITPDDCYDAMLPFVNLKESQGFIVTMTPLSEICSDCSSYDIKAYIRNAYDRWPIPPSYVLLVGDTDDIPPWHSDECHHQLGTVVTDLYYACMDDGGMQDWHPDMGRGRLPVNSVQEATNMVDKYLAYANVIGQEEWLKKVAFIATCHDYQWLNVENAHNYVIDNYTEPQGFTGTFPNDPQRGGDKLYCVTEGARHDDVVSCLNNGRWMVIYQGDCGWTGCEGLYFDYDIRNLLSEGVFPFVASFACSTGYFYCPYGECPPDVNECLGETWVLQENKGALAFWGSSSGTKWAPDIVLQKGMVDSLFGRFPFSDSEACPDLAQITEDALATHEGEFGEGEGRCYREMYNLLGDPATELWFQLKWAVRTGDYVSSSPAIGPDGTIYVGSYDNNLYSVSPDGTERWRFPTGRRMVSSPAISSDGTIYVGSWDNNLYAIYPDGREKWRFATGDYVGSSPAIGSDGTIYVGSWDSNLYAVHPDGREKWRFPTGGWVNSSPAIGSDGTIYVGSYDSNLYAVYPDGRERWRFETGHIVDSSPAIGSDGTIYVGSRDKNLYAIYSDGREKWRFPTGDWVNSSPAIGSDGTIYVGSRDRNLYAISPDGLEKWQFPTKDWVDSSPAIGSDGTIYVGSWDGNLYAIKSSSRGLADSPWPMFHHDVKHTGRARRPGWPCFITTAAYGSALSPEVNALRQFRDEYLLTSELGRAFVSTYYKCSPTLADCIAKHPLIRKIVRIGLYPILGLSKWIAGETNSEQD